MKRNVSTKKILSLVLGLVMIAGVHTAALAEDVTNYFYLNDGEEQTQAEPTDEPTGEYESTDEPTVDPEPIDEQILEYAPTDKPEPTDEQILEYAPTDEPEPIDEPLLEYAPVDEPAPIDEQIVEYEPTPAPTPAPPLPPAAPGEVRVAIEGHLVHFPDQPPAIVANRTLVPVRGVFEHLGFYVTWDRYLQQATLTREDFTVIISVGSVSFSTNDAFHTLDVPAQIINYRTMLPIRAVVESVGYYVGWADSTVLISATPFEEHVQAAYYQPHTEEPVTYYQPQAEEPAANRLPLEGRIIVLDAGHGLGADNVFMGYSEATAMLALAYKIKPLLEAHGAEVLLTRRYAYNVSLPVRAAKINLRSLEVLRNYRLQSNPNYNTQEIDRFIGIMQRIVANYRHYAPIYFNFPFDWTFTRRIHPELQRIFELQTAPAVRDSFLVISLHSNATGTPIDTSVNGADMYIMTRWIANDRNYFAYFTNEEQSRHFSTILLKNIEGLGIRSRGVRDGNWFIIREHNLPGVLAENGFHTNPHDRALLSCNNFLQRLALAYEDAIVRYFASLHT